LIKTLVLSQHPWVLLIESTQASTLNPY